MSQEACNTTRSRTVSFDYLRAVIILAVVVHHSVLAYMAMWPEQSKTFKIGGALVIDRLRWIGFDVLVGFNETYLMVLMFLLSGLFVWPALQRKGASKFLRARLLRLGVPFVAVMATVVPLAYYPSYAATGADPSFLAFARAWLSLGYWPSGPLWFLWLLIVFDAIAAGVHALRRRWMALQAVRSPGPYSRPAAFAAALLVVSALVYIPMEWLFGPERWLSFGPFSFQASRLLLYALYFGVGIQIGARGFDSGLFASNGGLARHGLLWPAAGLAAYALRLVVFVTQVQPAALAHQPLPFTARLSYDLTYVLCCCTISFAFIGLFRRFANKRQAVLDSLHVNAYGIYLIHIPFVIWLQFALLAAASGPLAKGIIVSVLAITLSWATAAALRRVPVVARVL
jgi:peptidoglycan/LPS O-acetylase OafA/YrhL